MRKRLIRVFVLAAVILGLAVVATELLLRVFPEARPSYVQQRIDALYAGDADDPGWSVPDDELGFVGKPLRHDVIETIDFTFTAESDEYGFANAGPWPERADIVFLGDSLLTGSGVGIDGQVTNLVAKRLPDYSVINLALSGASPQHLLRIFRRFGTQLHPKLVIAGLYVVSDVDNAKHFDAWERAGRQWGYNEFRRNHYLETRAKILGNDDRATDTGTEGTADRAEPVWRAQLRRAINATAVGTEFLYLLEPWRKGLLHEVEWHDGSKVFLFKRFQKRLVQGVGDDYPSISEIFFDPLRELRRAVEATGGTFVVVLIPSKEEIFTTRGNVDMLRLAREVRQHLDEFGMPVLDLYPPIAEVARTTAPFYPHDIHLNEAGNVAAANAIVDWINRGGLSRSP